MSDWQDIASAPKDREIFVWGCIESSPHSRPHIGMDDIERVHWHAEWESWEVTSAQCSGWVPHPTYWQPLPAPPMRPQALGSALLNDIPTLANQAERTRLLDGG